MRYILEYNNRHTFKYETERDRKHAYRQNQCGEHRTDRCPQTLQTTKPFLWPNQESSDTPYLHKPRKETECSVSSNNRPPAPTTCCYKLLTQHKILHVGVSRHTQPDAYTNRNVGCAQVQCLLTCLLSAISLGTA